MSGEPRAAVLGRDVIEHFEIKNQPSTVTGSHAARMLSLASESRTAK
jgi:hypothetical protein